MFQLENVPLQSAASHEKNTTAAFAGIQPAALVKVLLDHFFFFQISWFEKVQDGNSLLF